MNVYKITNVVNGKIYFGYTSYPVEKRFYKHVHNATVENRHNRLYSAMRKYGANNFVYETIDVFNGIDYDEMKMAAQHRERQLIQEHNSICKEIGYNMTPGGDGGMSLERRQQESRKRRGLTYEQIYGTKRAAEVKAKLSKSLKGKTQGRVVTKEQKQLISKRMKELHRDNLDYRKKAIANLDMTGFHGNHTAETKQKLRQFRLGKKYEEIFEEAKAKELKEKASERSKGENNNSWKGISVITIIETLISNPFIRLQDIGNKLGVTRHTISSRLKQYGIENIQLFRVGKTEEELKQYFERIHNEILCSEQ